MRLALLCYFFFFNDTATTEIYTLSLHDALPICDDLARAARVRRRGASRRLPLRRARGAAVPHGRTAGRGACGGRRKPRSEEHTSELQSRQYLVCRLLLEKKKITSQSILFS